MHQVLLVDDDASLCETLRCGLEGRGFTVHDVHDAKTALEAVRERDFDVVVSDLNMPGMSGIELCTKIVDARADVPVVVLTGFGSFDTAIAAIRAGAYDFLSKPVKLDALAISLERASHHRRLEAEVTRLRREVGGTPPTESLIGSSAVMRRVHDLIRRVAETDASILITGESGTGKEVVARAIHAASSRHDKPFVAINCSALPESLLESELFGHVRGAFTDAREARAGLFRQANGGTLFLDEIGDMPMGLQPKLLRVLQERTVRPVGGNQELPIDVRLVSATNRDLEGSIEERAFREDLFFRINVVNITLPPLRTRGSTDILALAQHFLLDFARKHKKEIRGMSAAAADRLVRYSWPGNVRELINSVEHAVTLAAFDQIGPDDLPPRMRSAPDAPEPRWEMSGELVSLAEMERHYIEHVLERVGGNKAAAARILEIERKTLYRKLQQWGVRTSDEADSNKTRDAQPSERLPTPAEPKV